jgi:hypothetical protein
MTDLCDIFWGSHGCSLPADPPHTIHVCSMGGKVCSEMRVRSGSGGSKGNCSVRLAYTDGSGWSEWDNSWTWFV